jgi:hypothetical protein
MVGGRKVEAWSREGGVREWTRRATVGACLIEAKISGPSSLGPKFGV